VPLAQPVFVEGSQFSVQSVTPGIAVPLLSFNVRTQRPPGAVHCESAVQNSPQVLVDVEVARQMPPGAQSLVVQSPPMGVVPAETQRWAPVPSIVHASPAAQPHCGDASLQGDSGHEPPAPVLAEVVTAVDEEADDEEVTLVLPPGPTEVEDAPPPPPVPVAALLLLAMVVEVSLPLLSPPTSPPPPLLPVAHAPSEVPTPTTNPNPKSQRAFISPQSPRVVRSGAWTNSSSRTDGAGKPYAANAKEQTSAEVFRENEALPAGARVVLDLADLPAEGLVKTYRTLVAERRDRLHAGCAFFAAVFFEGRVE